MDRKSRSRGTSSSASSRNKRPKQDSVIFLPFKSSPPTKPSLEPASAKRCDNPRYKSLSSHYTSKAPSESTERDIPISPNLYLLPLPLVLILLLLCSTSRNPSLPYHTLRHFHSRLPL